MITLNEFLVKQHHTENKVALTIPNLKYTGKYNDNVTICKTTKKNRIR